MSFTGFSYWHYWGGPKWSMVWENWGCHCWHCGVHLVSRLQIYSRLLRLAIESDSLVSGVVAASGLHQVSKGIATKGDCLHWKSQVHGSGWEKRTQGLGLHLLHRRWLEISELLWSGDFWLEWLDVDQGRLCSPYLGHSPRMQNSCILCNDRRTIGSSHLGVISSVQSGSEAGVSVSQLLVHGGSLLRHQVKDLQLSFPEGNCIAGPLVDCDNEWASQGGGIQGGVTQVWGWQPQYQLRASGLSLCVDKLKLGQGESTATTGNLNQNTNDFKEGYCCLHIQHIWEGRLIRSSNWSFSPGLVLWLKVHGYQMRLVPLDSLGLGHDYTRNGLHLNPSQSSQVSTLLQN